MLSWVEKEKKRFKNLRAVDIIVQYGRINIMQQVITENNM